MLSPIISDAVLIAFIGGIVSVVTARITTETKRSTNEIMKHLTKIDDRVNQVQSEVEQVKSIGLDNRSGIQRTQRYRLQEDMEQAIKQGYVTPSKLREISKLYESYINLGGNGEIKDLHEILVRLPIREKKGLRTLWNKFKQLF